MPELWGKGTEPLCVITATQHVPNALTDKNCDSNPSQDLNLPGRPPDPNKKSPCRVVLTRRGSGSVHWTPSRSKDEPHTTTSRTASSVNAITQMGHFVAFFPAGGHHLAHRPPLPPGRWHRPTGGRDSSLTAHLRPDATGGLPPADDPQIVVMPAQGSGCHRQPQSAAQRPG